MKWNVNISGEVKITIAVFIVFSLVAFTEDRRGLVVCKNVVVELVNVHDNHFLDETDVIKLLGNTEQNIKGKSIRELNLKRIERKILVDKHIEDAQLFTDLKGNLIVKVALRRPIARIVQEDAPDAYVADDGTVMGISEKFSSRVMLISGSFVKKFLEQEDLSKSEEGTQLLQMLKFIQGDQFWKAQVAQLNMEANGKITIYPQMTGQLIEFGKPDHVEEKFRKLMVFYKEILPQRGWIRYKRVNLEYDRQVVAE
jgi:cell division protein FtsQ